MLHANHQKTAESRIVVAIAHAWGASLETTTQFRGAAIALIVAASLPKDSISLPLRRDVDRAQRGRETAGVHDRFHPDDLIDALDEALALA
jgi:hypothetical protein